MHLVFLDHDLNTPTRTNTSDYSRLTNNHLSLQDEHENLVKEADALQRRYRQSSITVSDCVNSNLTQKLPGVVERNMNLWRISVRVWLCIHILWCLLIVCC
jgi:hypothetical protein